MTREYGSKRSSLGASLARAEGEEPPLNAPAPCVKVDTTLEARTPRSTRTPERSDKTSTKRSRSEAGLSPAEPSAEKSKLRASSRAIQSTVAKCKSAAA